MDPHTTSGWTRLSGVTRVQRSVPLGDWAVPCSRRKWVTAPRASAKSGLLSAALLLKREKTTHSGQSKKQRLEEELSRRTSRPHSGWSEALTRLKERSTEVSARR